jgi:hypothetical protein
MQSLIVLICFLFMSCSSLDGLEKGKRYFQVNAYDINGDYYKHRVYFYTMKDSEFHCFEDNSKNKEVITLNANYLHYAVDHFFKRKAGIDVKLKQYPNGYKLDVAAIRIDSHIPLEVASCIRQVKVGLWKVIETELVSLRVAD